MALSKIDLGYDFLLWGHPGDSFLYGYLRPSITADTAWTYNSLESAVELFPISIFGVKAGGEAIQNDEDYTPYNCQAYACRGRFYRLFVQGQLTLGAGPVFVQARVRRESWNERDQSADFIEPTNGVLLKRTGDAETFLSRDGRSKVESKLHFGRCSCVCAKR